jgi:GNAT superfamily N-acetyltransferase
MSVNYRIATECDVPLILQYIKDLAEYEKLLHEVVADENDIFQTLFGNNKGAFAVIAEEGGSPVGFALCFYNYSTFQGRYGIYIEDLYVPKEHRGKGIGKGFFKYLAKRAIKEGCGRIQWWVLNWNEPSIKFYESLGATPMDEFTVFRLEGDGIKDLAT